MLVCPVLYDQRDLTKKESSVMMKKAAIPCVVVVAPSTSTICNVDEPFIAGASLAATSSTMKKKSAEKTLAMAKVSGLSRAGGGKSVAVGVKQKQHGDQQAVAKVSGYNH